MKVAESKLGSYLLTVGLEIHAELRTRTKMFCDSKNDPDEHRPNVNICPVCLGYPGTLPVINKEALRSVLRLGLAVGSKLADYTEFDRKNYFYPDLPKGYQISQYRHPLVSGGSLNGVKLTRIHLEEDTAKSTHDSRLITDDYSLLDFNRAGVPLVELVTEPMIHDPEQAGRFAREFQLLLVYLDIAYANMEKGEMRVEANVSVTKDKPLGSGLGTKVEIKNLNSFRSVQRAIEYEFRRQSEILEKGEKVIQETRGWNEEREETFSQRAKEESHDYRYFPDPDLPKIFIKDVVEFEEKVLRASLPEMPWQKRERYRKNFGLKENDVEIYLREPQWGRLLEDVAQILGKENLIKIASNYIANDLKKSISAEALAAVIRMISAGEISSRGAKDILKIIQEQGGEPKNIAEENNLIQINNREMLRKIVDEIVKENPKAPIQFLVGQAMKKTEGRANPIILRELFLEMLDG